MSTISKPYTFSPSTTASSSEVNADFDTLYNDYNGNINASNLATGAVSTAKIADGAVTTDKMNDAAITPPKWSNPYKFRVYRAAAENIATGPAVVLFDTKSYDTSSNVDVVTNQGRFTAPVSGTYQFNARVSSGAATTIAIIHLYKNGSAMTRGSDIRSSVSTAGLTVSDCVQLTAGDYVEVYAQFNTTIALEVGSPLCYFSGFLVSIT